MKTKKLRIFLDTNVFLVSILPKFKYYWIFESLRNELYELILSNDILIEYEEIISEKFKISDDLFSLDFFKLYNNVHLIEIHYKWNLINADPDDNKFVDCAIAGNADYIVTEDKHFDLLKAIEFPKVQVIDIKDFKQLVLNNQ